MVRLVQARRRQDGGALRQGQEKVKPAFWPVWVEERYKLALLRSPMPFSGSGSSTRLQGVKIMRKILFGPILLSAVAAAVVSPAGAAGDGGGGSGHGAAVSAAAHSAHMGSAPTGTSVRDTARAQSQGPTHASATAISHVQNSPGKANSNSVLGNGGSTTTPGGESTTTTSGGTTTMTNGGTTTTNAGTTTTSAGTTTTTSTRAHGKSTTTAKSGKSKNKKSIH